MHVEMTVMWSCNLFFYKHIWCSILHRLRPLLDSMGTTLINDTRAFKYWSCINVAGQSGRAYLNARAGRTVYKAATPPDCHPFLFSERDNTWPEKHSKKISKKYLSSRQANGVATAGNPCLSLMPGLIAGADPHQLCFECLGPDHTED